MNAKMLRKTQQEQAEKSKQELELLVAGEHEDDDARDYDIRGIQRLEKNQHKKFTGSRKRNEAKRAADVAGTTFQINVDDPRFGAVLDGTDARFGIDKTAPQFKNTTAMRTILSEQSKRRKQQQPPPSAHATTKTKRHKKNTTAHHTNTTTISSTVPPDVTVDNKQHTTSTNTGANALSALVQKLKSRVS